MSDDYRVELDIYNGPLDLLLYLIRKEEVDIYDIPIARITDQYLAYVRYLQELDPNLAGEFLVLAATLMEIKSRTLLPREPETEEENGDDLDPRTELVRQLLEYKRFKDAASWLGEAADEQSQKFARVPVLPQVGAEELELEDVQIWDLVEAFGRLLQQTLAGPPIHDAGEDDTPLALYQADIVDRLKREGPMTFSRVFEGRKRRVEMIGLFIAMLELIRQGMIQIEQDEPLSEIYIYLRVEIPDDGQAAAPTDQEPAEAPETAAHEESQAEPQAIVEPPLSDETEMEEPGQDEAETPETTDDDPQP
ncbi:MAG: segregation/condensation protein A [Phycisphaerae bacterium]|nr:segregation/condensation protein A [Phycisphaerae bacterium]